MNCVGESWCAVEMLPEAQFFFAANKRTRNISLIIPQCLKEIVREREDMNFLAAFPPTAKSRPVFYFIRWKTN